MTPQIPGAGALRLELDDAWRDGVLDLPSLDLRVWGPRLRYIAPRRVVEAFWREVEPLLEPFALYGSGDFHYLSGVLVRRAGPEPLTLVSFDNHPDWDIRPPYWSCGGWAARAARSERVRRVSVWGCGNFEFRLPARTFADRAALEDGRLEVHPWAERQPPRVRARYDCMGADTWRGRFERFAEELAGGRVYVTVDMDCLRTEEAATNWENGLFTAGEVAWAIETLRREADVVGGDVCGAYSPPEYARAGQRFAGRWDHPRLEAPDPERARRANEASLATIWPALTAQARSAR